MNRMKMKTEILPAEGDSIAKAADLLRRGELVALPTETVYGIAADARNGAAVAKIFVAKGRPQDNPLIVHVTGPFGHGGHPDAQPPGGTGCHCAERLRLCGPQREPFRQTQPHQRTGCVH